MNRFPSEEGVGSKRTKVEEAGPWSGTGKDRKTRGEERKRRIIAWS